MNKEDTNQQIGKLEKWEKPFAYTGVVLNLLMVFSFLSFWIFPDALDIERIHSYAVLIAFEFIMVHSGVPMALLPARISLFVIFPFYALFAFAFNASMNNNIILYTYLVVVFNRMRYAFFNVNKEIKIKTIIKSFVAVILYITFIIIAVACSSSIPSFGLSPSFLQKNNFYHIVKTHGILVDQPHVAMCIGTLYYFSLAIVEYIISSRSINAVKLDSDNK